MPSSKFYMYIVRMTLSFGFIYSQMHNTSDRSNMFIVRATLCLSVYTLYNGKYYGRSYVYVCHVANFT